MKNKTVIISRTDSIGDVVLTLPMAGVIKNFEPHCRIIFLGTDLTLPVIRCCNYIDEVANYSEVAGMAVPHQAEWFQKLSADVIVHVFPRKEIAAAAKMAGIAERIGTSHRLYHLFTCNKRVHFGRKNSLLHEAQLNLKLLKPLGCTQEYSPDRISALLPERKYNILVTGTKEESSFIGNAFTQVMNRIQNLSGLTDVTRLIALLNISDGIVACSTGPLHLAAAMGKVAIGLFPPIRPMHPGRWKPLGEKAIALSIEKNCTICRTRQDCECINRITPEEVAGKIEELSVRNG
ncbi:MAG: glycosyltransferase family 9 protein [Bacteroidetes bacterium]|nr:glycosyltransferase family 9 protein [Bacteroidota bacterium]